ncbi:hypothetical protein SAY87_010328 [Trapa incisa]|uniref:Uncharacterized protein n=1 Tax=Trapa incisa TaxID=236973 RepID=A0AAN7GHK9_9MYRT|nr:hypothetical protein SAY87_010328 [Trapa incisa]
MFKKNQGVQTQLQNKLSEDITITIELDALHGSMVGHSWELTHQYCKRKPRLCKWRSCNTIKEGPKDSKLSHILPHLSLWTKVK